MADWQHGVWWSNDNLRLHYRDHAGPTDAESGGRPPIICIPGLTRNARDYEGVAARLAGQWRVICIDLRGRGESAYAPDPMTYVPLTYVQDIERLLDTLKIDRFVAFGTSLGGIVTMLLAATDRGRVAGALLNDVGPEIDPAGLDRIRGYVGKSANHPTWLHAARALAEANAAVYPDWAIAEWLVMAKRLFRLTSAGRIVLDYDMRIAEPFRIPGNESGVDMWPALDALAGVPVLVARGERSDILSAATADKVVARLGDAETVTVPRVGHAPTLEEPEVTAAIDRLLAKVFAKTSGA